MATKKTETLFVVSDTDRCCFVNSDHEQETSCDTVIFHSEKAALDAAQDSMSGNTGDFDDEDCLTVFKLVPVAKVKRSALVVEKL